MSEIDLVSRGLSEDEGLGADRKVPVGESIRYRKRAQAAEQKVQELDSQLHESRAQSERLSAELDAMGLERRLAGSLVSAGVSDLDTAMLVVRERLSGEGSDEADVDSVVEQLRVEKSYLFGGFEGLMAAERTSGVKDRSANSKSILESTAKRAVSSGSRADVQEYMRVRRQFV